MKDKIEGHKIVVFASTTSKNKANSISKINDELVKNFGSFALPKKIFFLSALPKTRSGKIMRRILRKLASNEMDQLGDISTLLNPEIVDEIKKELS